MELLDGGHWAPPHSFPEPRAALVAHVHGKFAESLIRTFAGGRSEGLCWGYSDLRGQAVCLPGPQQGHLFPLQEPGGVPATPTPTGAQPGAHWL